MITVVIPTYHRNKHLAKCLDCLAPGAQSLPIEQYQVIVTDDGTQNTAQQMVQEQYPWAQWVAGPGIGLPANRNNGVKFAIGEWLAFTDDDCLPSPGWLSAYLAAVEPGIELYEGRTICSAGLKSPLEESPINLTGNCLWGCNLMISRRLYHSVGGFAPQFVRGEDMEFRNRLVRAGYTYPFVHDAVIDHPPRGRAVGKKAASHWEMQFVLMNNNDSKRRTIVDLFLLVVRVRLKTLLSYPFSMDSVKAIAFLLVELFHLTYMAPRWNRKYKTKPLLSVAS